MIQQAAPPQLQSAPAFIGSKHRYKAALLQPGALTHVRGRLSLNRVEFPAIVVYVPEPGFLHDELRIIENPD